MYSTAKNALDSARKPTIATRCAGPAGVLAALLLLVACTNNGASNDPSGAQNVQGPVDTSDFSDAIHVTPSLDDSLAVTKTVGLEGGTIEATAADGTVFTLAIPADSMRLRTRITMTPVTRIDGLPFGDGPSYAVDLQPSGLVFDVPATLSIVPPAPIEVAEQLFFTYQGSAVMLARPVLDSAELQIAVEHFSGYGVAKGLLGDIEEAKRRFGENAAQRISSEMSALLHEERERELAGGEPSGYSEEFEALLDQFEAEVLEVRLAALGESCAAARVAADTLFGYQRTLLVLGIERPYATSDIRPAWDARTSKCMQEEYEMCITDHVVHRLPTLYYHALRNNALVGLPSDNVIAKSRQQVEDCLRFELEFTTTAVGTADWAIMQVHSEDTASFTADLAYDTEAFSFGVVSATMESEQPIYTVTATGCTAGKPRKWRGDARVIKLRMETDGADLDKELGSVTGLTLELDLPEATLSIPYLVCNGTDGGSFEDSVTSAAFFRMAHPGQVIKEWTPQGGEDFAVATWDVTVHTETGKFQESGTAQLRHTPR